MAEDETAVPMNESFNKAADQIKQRAVRSEKAAWGSTWVNYGGNNPFYRKKLDRVEKINFIKFYVKPDAELLSVMKSEEAQTRGIRYREHPVHGGIWYTKADPSGIAAIEAIDFKLRAIIDKRREAERG